MEITSRENPLIKEIHALLHSGKARRKSGRMAVEGARLCADAVCSGFYPIAALVTTQAVHRYPKQWEAVQSAAQTVCTISQSLARYLSDTENPQGVFCLVQRPVLSELTIDPGGIYFALEAVRDPGNLGSAVRTAEALGINGLILSDDCCDLFSPKVLRASMGGVFRLPLEICRDLVSRVAQIGSIMPTLACVVGTGASPITRMSASGALAVIGNEGSGLSDSMISVCSRRVTIPMKGHAQSMNASVAAGILMWELSRT